MIKAVEITLFPNEIDDVALLNRKAAKKANVDASEITKVLVKRRSIDARGKRPVYRLMCEIYMNEEPKAAKLHREAFLLVADKPRVLIIGAGPAGYFAALRCLKLGLQPIVLERGKDVQARRKDLRAIQQFGEVNPHSNYCFGEGGAGTYSDGKLYTRSQKRGKIIDVLELFVEHGASEDILIDAHPHIGSNKLPKIIANMRATIEAFGGEVHFDTFVTDFIVEGDAIVGVETEQKEIIKGAATILATGHSARDVFYKLHEKGIAIEAKPFALGLRIEHPQSFIDSKQYNQAEREENLPAASYGVVTQVDDCGVFSFCMCPGGLIVPSATAPGEIIVNGMSLSRRDSPFANSGFVTSIETEELQQKGYTGIFGNLDFQREVEQKMFGAGDGTQKAPAQKVTDFIKGVSSSTLNDTSYIPGLFSANFKDLLPDFVYKRLAAGLVAIDKKMKGYVTEEANLVGIESRTSSPIRVPRNRETMMHEQVKGLFPCGEGAGYAGGILSAAMDGQNCAEAVLRYLSNK